MWVWLFRIFQIAATASLGYVANDAASAAGEITGVKANDKGKYPMWFVLLIFVLLGGIVYLLISIVKTLLPAKDQKKVS